MSDNIIHSLFPKDELCRAVLSDNIETRKSDGSYLNRLVCRWDEKTEQKNIHSHIYAAGMDQHNQVYLDCRKRLIASKILVSTAIRPLHCVVKVLYHLSMIPVAKALFAAMMGQIRVKTALKRSVRSIADIVRTPAYEAAMIGVGIVALASAVLVPSSLYKFREIIGKIEIALFRTEFHSFALTPCFESQNLLQLVEDFGITQSAKGEALLSNFEDTEYGGFSVENLMKNGIVTKVEDQDKTVYKINNLDKLNTVQKHLLRDSLAQRSIIHYGRAMIKTQRNHYNPFYNLMGRLSKMKTYISPAYHKIDEVNEAIKSKTSQKTMKASQKTGTTKAPRHIRFAPDATVITQIGQHKTDKGIEFLFKTESKPLIADDLRHKAKTKKNMKSPKNLFVQAVTKDLNTKDKRINWLVKSIAIAFEIAHDDLMENIGKGNTFFLENFKNDLNKMLEGNATPAELERSGLSRQSPDYRRFLRTAKSEATYKKQLHESAMKHAAKMLANAEKKFKKTQTDKVSNKENIETTAPKSKKISNKENIEPKTTKSKRVSKKDNVGTKIKTHHHHHTKKSKGSRHSVAG